MFGSENYAKKSNTKFLNFLQHKSFQGLDYTEKRIKPLSQMRLRSVFKMRMSILNTATTEQMG